MTISLAQFVTLADGAGEYARAIASGDIAAEEVQRARVRTCAACPSLRLTSYFGGLFVLGSCGEPGKPATSTRDASESGFPGPVCGCGLFAAGFGAARIIAKACRGTGRVPAEAAPLVAGIVTPALKAEVGSARCPQARWAR